MMALPRLRLYTLGGTIAMMPQAGGGAAPALDGAALLAAVPGLDALADIAIAPVANIGSANLGFSHMIDLAKRIAQDEARGFDGVIIVQGTDTLADSAFILSLICRPGIPVIATGAMRHPGLASADGPGNLLAAAIAASDRRLAGQGAFIVMQDCLIAARTARKAHTVRPDAFSYRQDDPAGLIVEGRLRLNPLPRMLPFLDVETIGEPVPLVPLVMALYDDQGQMLDHLPPDTRGLVIAAFGGGHLSESMADKAAALSARMPVILASQTGAGPVLQSSYGYKGAEIDLLAGGLISAGEYSAAKARILLGLLLAANTDRMSIARIFAE